MMVLGRNGRSEKVLKNTNIFFWTSFYNSMKIKRIFFHENIRFLFLKSKFITSFFCYLRGANKTEKNKHVSIQKSKRNS